MFSMQLKIISWNVRSLNDQDKRLQVKHLLKLWQANMICLQETKLDLINRELISSLWVYIMWIGCISVPMGLQGVIILMWDMRVVEKIEDAVGNFSVSCKLRTVIDHQESIFSGIYSPQMDRERMTLWDELASLFT
jgi:exonuclease III